jgi:DNA invertase Pin-like site-specific DNA recombinase
MKFGYARISTEKQKLDLQIDSLLANGIDIKNIYTDISSGAKADRPGLESLETRLREGDEVIVWKMDRLARSVSHMCKISNRWKEQGVEFRSITEPFLDTASSHGQFVFTMFAAMSQLERDILIERTNAGLAAAKKKGRTGGRPRGLSKENEKKARLAETLYKDGTMTIKEMCDTLNIKAKSTIYKYLRHRGVKVDGYEPKKT